MLWGKDTNGHQRFRCRPCRRTFAERPARPLGSMRLVRGVEVKDVQADEIWNFVAMKERTKARQGIEDQKRGDAWTFVGFERDSKLALAWHLGRRDNANTDAFCEKLAAATAGRFQLTTDGWASYPQAIGFHLGERTDYAVLVKAARIATRRYPPTRGGAGPAGAPTRS